MKQYKEKIMNLIDKYLGEYLGENSDIENNIRDHLSGTNRKVDQKTMWSLVQSNMKGVNKKDFDKTWKSLVSDDFLVKVGNAYKWEM